MNQTISLKHKLNEVQLGYMLDTHGLHYVLNLLQELCSEAANEAYDSALQDLRYLRWQSASTQLNHLAEEYEDL